MEKYADNEEAQLLIYLRSQTEETIYSYMEKGSSLVLGHANSLPATISGTSVMLLQLGIGAYIPLLRGAMPAYADCNSRTEDKRDPKAITQIVIQFIARVEVCSACQYTILLCHYKARRHFLSLHAHIFHEDNLKHHLDSKNLSPNLLSLFLLVTCLYPA